MARTAEGNRLTAVHRSRQIATRSATLRDLMRLWRSVDPTNLEETINPFADAATTVIGAKFEAAAAVAVRYFQDFRRAEGASGGVTILTPDPPNDVSGLLRGAALSGIVNGRRRGFSVQAAAQNGLVKVSGSASDLIMSAPREVITQATAADPASTGRWRRVTSGDACPFCLMLADRGAVFQAQTADFEAHNHCGCVAEPEF